MTAERGCEREETDFGGVGRQAEVADAIATAGKAAVALLNPAATGTLALPPSKPAALLAVPYWGFETHTYTHLSTHSCGRPAPLRRAGMVQRLT